MATKTKGKVAVVSIAATATKPAVMMVEVALDEQLLTIVDKPEQEIKISPEIRAMAEALINRIVLEAQK